MNDFKPIMTQEELDRIVKARLKRERTKMIKIGGLFIKALKRDLQVLQEQLDDME